MRRGVSQFQRSPGSPSPGLRLDRHHLAAGPIVAHDPPVLRLGVHDVRVGGIHLALEAVAAVGDHPVRVHDAVLAGGPRRPAQGEVVLRAAVDVVERRVVVQRHLVELRHRQVGLELPRLRPVPALVDAAVVAVQVVVRVARVLPEGVVVHVLALLSEAAPAGPPVVGDLRPHVHGDDAVTVGEVTEDLRVVVAAGVVAAALLERAGAVGGAEEAAAIVSGLDDRVDVVGIDRRDAQTDPAHVSGGKSGGDLRPAVTPVRGLVHRGARAASDVGPHVAAPLPRGGVQDVRIARVHQDLVDAGVLVDVEDARPRRAAVRGLVEPPVSAGAPQRALCGDEHDVPVLRMHEDPPDVLGSFEPHALPCSSAVHGLVHAVAVGHAALGVVLTGAHPHHVGVARVEGDDADGIRAFAAEHGLERRTVVHRLPHTSRRRGDVPGPRVLAAHGEVRDPARGDGRSDLPQGDAAEVGGGEEGVLRVDGGRGEQRRQRHRRKERPHGRLVRTRGGGGRG